jgi:hypothetical protein
MLRVYFHEDNLRSRMRLQLTGWSIYGVERAVSLFRLQDSACYRIVVFQARHSLVMECEPEPRRLFLSEQTVIFSVSDLSSQNFSGQYYARLRIRRGSSSIIFRGYEGCLFGKPHDDNEPAHDDIVTCRSISWSTGICSGEHSRYRSVFDNHVQLQLGIIPLVTLRNSQFQTSRLYGRVFFSIRHRM